MPPIGLSVGELLPKCQRTIPPQGPEWRLSDWEATWLVRDVKLKSVNGRALARKIGSLCVLGKWLFAVCMGALARIRLSGRDLGVDLGA